MSHLAWLLPVFFFHGITRNQSDGFFLENALAAQNRTLVALNFSSDEMSVVSLHQQVPLAIAQIRDIVAKDERFQNGYVFMGHSQGGLVARAVVEEMDDHKVHTLISFAGIQNGLFYGPQREDVIPTEFFLNGFGAMVLPTKPLDLDKYKDDQAAKRGQLQFDLAKVFVDRPELQNEFSFMNMQRLPSHADFLAINSFLPAINNVNQWKSKEDKLNQERRKRNFLKLHNAHFFMSPADGAVAPWQSSLFGRYSFVGSVDEIPSKFEELTIVPMRETEEYVNDTFGLRTLDKRGALHLHEVADIPHVGWIADAPLMDDPTRVSKFQDVFDNHIASALP